MRRVVVVGNSGSGKTTISRALADRLGVPHVELDAIFHQPDWQELPRPEFRRRVAAAVAHGGWVVDGNYSAVRDIVWPLADTLVWVDPPRRTVLRRVVTRTLRRVVTRQELWNGNREPWRNLTTLDPERSIIAWSWSRHAVDRERLGAVANDPTYPGLRVVHVATKAQARTLLAGAGPARG